MDRLGDGCVQADGGNFTVTEFQHAHTKLPRPGRNEPGRSNWIVALCSWRERCQEVSCETQGCFDSAGGSLRAAPALPSMTSRGLLLFAEDLAVFHDERDILQHFYIAERIGI